MTRTMTRIQAYALQRGLFSRVAKKLGVDPSYVSRVANGYRTNKRIMRVIEAELNKIDGATRKIKQQSSRKKKPAAQ